VIKLSFHNSYRPNNVYWAQRQPEFCCVLLARVANESGLCKVLRVYTHTHTQTVHTLLHDVSCSARVAMFGI
jgi:hypothetical protein